MVSIRAYLGVIALLLAAASGGQAAAVVCVADCNDDGAVRINELVAAVNIALGGALSACPGADANGDGQVTINELVSAVSDALYGCGVTPPTPVATPTATATFTPTASPSPSPTPSSGVDVSGHWRSDRATLQSSSCVKAINDAVRASIRNGSLNCDYAIVQHGANADVTETCTGETMVYTVPVAPDGTITYVFEESDSANGCDFTVTTMVVAPLAQSPTTITGTYDFAFEPSCGLAACRLIVSGRLRRVP